MQQLKSIAEDYRRHQDILEQRKKEIISLKKETESEENNRESYLADVERNLEKQLHNRQMDYKSGGISAVNQSNPTEELHNRDFIELATVDEFSLYEKRPVNARGGRGGTRGRGGSGRGRKRKQT